MSEVSSEIIAKTQKSLGKYVKKPILSEKLLRKPPFRFLHDVIKAAIRETGFLDGLFSDEELNSENVKEKEAKVAFLSKLIDAVKTVSKTDLKVRPSKIVAGLEPMETNILLQTIAKSIDRKIDTKDYVVKVQSGQAIGKERSSKTSKGDKEKEKKVNSKERTKKDVKTRDSSVTRLKKTGSIETPKSTDRPRDSSRSKSKITKPKAKEEISDKKGSRRKGVGDKSEDKNKEDQNISEDNFNSIDNKGEQAPEAISTIPNSGAPNPFNDISKIASSATEVESVQKAIKTEEDVLNFSNARQSSAGLVRPKSARPKSGDRILSSKVKEDLQGIGTVTITQRPSSSLRPPSVRPSSARPGAPRLRPDSALSISEPVVMGNINVIIENFDGSLGDDEETVVIQTAPEVSEDDGVQSSELLNISGNNKGQLVEQILEQIQEGQEAKKKIEIDWELNNLRGKDAATKEVTQLRTLIQSLTKVANPLGKLMNYLHEDLDAMHNELQMWTNIKKQLYLEIEKQKKLAVDSSKPQLDKLELLRRDIKRQEQEILSVRSNILKNEQRIAEVLGNK